VLREALLERSGYGVLIAPSAQQGLKLATTCICDAVLLEYEMSGMNGHEVGFTIPYTVESPRPVPRPTSLVVKKGSKI